ncbi:MAG: amidohydrolase [Deltaproteobacteria bacterium]|jgi:amidohydrolase|nr:amidohydrolase [Deltaproteobacteria bacterium]
MLNFKKYAKQIERSIVENRRALHRRPEPGFAEHRTTGFIQEELRRCGIDIIPWGGSTGVVGLLNGTRKNSAGENRCVALRADIDALPVTEAVACNFCSENQGFMHACGHDAHMAGLLGAARILSERREEFGGKIKFIFQPAEEVMQASGARLMLQAGVLENPEVGFIFGMHCTPEAEAGQICLPHGALTAATALTFLRVTGAGGHGALPHLAKDPLVASAAIIMALQTLISREIHSGEAAVISFGSIHGGTAGNIIPEQVEIYGTARAIDADIFNYMERRMGEIIALTGQALRVNTEFEFRRGPPSCVNPPELADWAGAGPLREVFGQRNILPFKPVLVGEDFACFQEKIPGLLCWFGVGNKAKNIAAPLHSSFFQIEESALYLAAATYAQVACDWLNR